MLSLHTALPFLMYYEIRKGRKNCSIDFIHTLKKKSSGDALQQMARYYDGKRIHFKETYTFQGLDLIVQMSEAT